MSPALVIVAGVVLIFILLTLTGSFFTVATSQAAVLQRFGDRKSVV